MELTNDIIQARRRREHFEKYEALAKQIGLGPLINKVFHLKFQVEKALRDGDHSLKTIPLATWDHLSGYDDRGCVGMHYTAEFDAPPWTGWRHLSLGERVCVLKHVARHYVAEEDNDAV